MKIFNLRTQVNEILTNSLILFPFILIFLSEILLPIVPMVSSVFKVGAVLYMFLFAIISLKFHASFLILLGLFIPLFIYGILHSFNIYAAISEGIRYLFPISVLMYGYAIRRHFKFLLMAFIVFVIINDLWQIVNYVNWYRGVTQWFYNTDIYGNRYFNASSGIIRATGIVGFFGLFGFINLIAFFLTRRYYTGKWKTLLLSSFLISLFLSFSYKTIGALLVLLFLQYKNKLKFFQIVGILFVIALIAIPKVVASMGESIILRLEQYVTEGDSARAESYRVMFAEISNFNLFGRGVGSFGGPASVTYNSPIYSEHHFNWFYTIDLTTTDTFFPHLFVEMGLIGGLLYLLVLLAPLTLSWKRDKFKLVFAVYFALFFDALFSYSLNNIAFLIVSIGFLYPLYFYREEEPILTEDVYNPIDS
ncbi:hypothetical protein QRD02_01800 [Aequorivita sp. SDUM287046]|uniref:O-antigen ligase domain-containing protein n=2 Tax=Aequorivita aurantiaca TaxID=3053356 RepID=A0ABT8DD47_9FLAO|nr:hypothetical protein [Aequorivita aurantiaca]